MNNTALQYVQNTNVDRYSKNPEGLLKWIVKNLPNDKVVMGTGFGPPGIVLLDMLFKVTNNISVFYIDTSFLFEQTYDLKKKLEEKYGYIISHLKKHIKQNNSWRPKPSSHYYLVIGQFSHDPFEKSFRIFTVVIYI